MIRDMIFLLPCKLFSKFRWPFFCLWYSRLSFNGIFYKKGISVKGHLQLVLSFLWSLYLTVYKTGISLRQTLSARPKGVPLRKSWLVFDAPTSVYCCCCFCTGEAVLNLVRGSFYTWMIRRFLMSNERRMYILYAFSNLTTADLLSRLAAYTSHPKWLHSRYNSLIR